MINLSQIRMVTAMNLWIDNSLDNDIQMDRSTSLAVCDGIGERLRDLMRPGAGHLPPRLQQLMDQLQQLDDAPSLVPDLTASPRKR
ncbi:MAG: hypothetical protein EKK40_06440 [Bradyrhizobiaceae bacterium]|nr:MAG: hypothetical protein EKK40_06440 [Bradyrhizobiaceae bacterium]